MALGATTYTAVTWTTGDVITEAKLDNMVANDQAYDSHASNGIMLNNNVGYYQKDSGGTARAIANLDASDLLTLGDGTNMEVAPATMAKARAYLNAAQNNIADSTFTKILYDTESYDIGSDFDTGNNKFVTPVAGYYLIVVSVSITPSVADKRVAAAVYVNGSSVSQVIYHTSSTAAMYAQCTAVEYVAAATDIEGYVWHNFGVGTSDLGNATAQTFMMVHLLSV